MPMKSVSSWFARVQIAQFTLIERLQIKLQNLESSASSASSSVFQLWITQWQLGILDPREATFVLKTVLVGLRSRKVDAHFWKFLRQFFASPKDAGTSFLIDEAESEQLIQRACSLPSLQAKLLLEYLGRRYAFDGDDLQFWMAVRAAMELYTAPSDKLRANFC